jgi:hypothetical protein
MIFDVHVLDSESDEEEEDVFDESQAESYWLWRLIICYNDWLCYENVIDVITLKNYEWLIILLRFEDMTDWFFFIL